MLDGLDDELIPGLGNVGMLATHELRVGVPRRADWSDACKRGRKLLHLGGRALVEALGFGVSTLGTTSSVLTVADGKRAVAVFLDEGETFEDVGPRFGALSPVSHALALASREGLPWVVLTRASQIRLYAARVDTGVGRKGRAETYVEVDVALLPTLTAGYLPLLFGADALSDDGSFEEILIDSGRFAVDLGKRLRDRVYFDAVPALATAVASRLRSTDAPSDGGQASLRVRPMREFDATNDKHHFTSRADEDHWPVYKGASFNLWEPDTGTYYASADPEIVVPVLQNKRLRQQRLARSAFSEFPREWAFDANTLPCLHRRIAFP